MPPLDAEPAAVAWLDAELSNLLAVAQCMRLGYEIGHRNSEFEALYGLGQADLATGHPDQALVRHRHALDIACKLGQAPDQSRAHEGMARACHALGRHDQAHQHWRRAVFLA